MSDSSMPGLRPSDAQHLTYDEIADYAEGLLDPAGQSAAASHLSACPECSAVQEQLTSVSSLLAAAADRGPLPEHVAARLEAALADEGRQAACPSDTATETGSSGKPTWRRWAPRVLSAAAAVALVFFGFTLGQRSTGGDDSESASDAAGSSGEVHERAGEPEALSDGAARDDASPMIGLGDPAVVEATAKEILAAPGRDEVQAGCGAAIGEAFDREVLGSSPIDWAGTSAIVVVVTPPANSVGLDAEAFVVPSCASDPADALYVTAVESP